jgi:hypothetical protein
MCISYLNWPNEAVGGEIIVSSISKRVLFPLEACLLFEKRAENWVAPLTFDPAYLHAMIFTSQHYFDTIASHGHFSVTKSALPHFVHTLRLLHERFSRNEDEMQLSDTTAAAVMCLTGHALLTGNMENARNHMEGLRRIVILKGGVGSLRANTKLLIEILR